MTTEKIETTCCVVGGGPAGLMLGFLLARAGVDVHVLEKHADFLRDFRGDTVHPSTLELMYELGLLEKFLKLPHEKVTKLSGIIGDDAIQLVDFSHLRTQCKYVALMPQWDFLDFLSDQAKKYDSFNLHMSTNATGLIEESGRIAGVVAESERGELEIRADLVVGADGRTSITRECAGLTVQDVGAPMDVLWMRISRLDTDPAQSLGRLRAGGFLVMLNRGDYWQCGFLIPKGQLEEYKSAGLPAFRKSVAELAPFLSDRVDELKTWDVIKLLTVKVDRLRTWYKQGLLCIGDAAHAMSPVGGVGINLAIQDAVATANILWKPLSERSCTVEDLQNVQLRRLYPARMTQRLQVAIQNNVIKRILKTRGELSAPWFMHAFNAMPLLRRLPAAIIGIGFRAEHIESPDVAAG